MSTINLADISKNPPGVQRDLKEWNKANPAEHLEAMQRRGELKSLSPASFDRAYRPRLSVRSEPEPDQLTGHGFKFADRVQLSAKGMQAASLCGLPQSGIVTGIRGPFIRVGAELYNPQMWEKS